MSNDQINNALRAQRNRRKRAEARSGGANGAPTGMSVSNLAFNDVDSANGYTIGTISVTDPEGDGVTLTLTSDPSGFFKISGNALQCATAGITAATYPITIRALDIAGNTYSHSFNIVCSHVNVAPNDITITGTSFNDYDASGTAIGTVAGVDPNGDTCTVTLTDDSAGKFILVGNVLKTNAANIAVGSYNVTLRASDGSLTFDKIISLTSAHSNRAPTDITLSAASFADNVPTDTLIGSLTSTDPDTGETFTYSIISDPANKFKISNGNEVRTNAANIVAGTYGITVRTFDTAGLHYDKAITLTSTHTGVAPTDIALVTNQLNDDAGSGSTIGSFSVTDANPGDTSTITLTDDASGKFTVVSNVLKSAVANIAAGSYNITALATDSDGLTFSKTLSVLVVHHNDAPSNISLSNASVTGGSIADTTIGTLTATDPDSGDTFTFALTTNPSSYFKITSGGPGVTSATLKTNATVPQGSYSIGVRCTDQSGAFFDKTFTITATEAPVAPTDIQISASSFLTTAASGTTIGSLTSTDANAGNTFTYSLITNPSSYFQIVGAALKTNASSIPEADYSVTIRSTDSDGLTFDKTLTITSTRTFQTETTALVAAFTTPPTTTRKRLIDDTIANLKAHNVWATLDLLYVCASEAQDQSQINWVDPTHFQLTSSGTVTWTANQGWVGSATANCKLNTGFNPLNQSGRKNSTSSAGVGAYVKTNSTTGTRCYGCPGFGVTARTSTKGSIEIQSTTGIAYTGANTSYQGFFQGRRVDSANAAAWLNLGASGFATANAATTLATNTMDLAGGGGNSTTSGSVHQVRLAYSGAGHSDTDVTNLYNDLLAYLTSVGANLTTGL